MSPVTAAQTNVIDPTELLAVLARIKVGDFTARMPLDWTGLAGKVADGLNDVIIANQALEMELARVSEVVGKQGQLSQRVLLGGWTRSWASSVDSVNGLIEDLVRPTIEMQRVIGAVANGDLTKKVSADVRGEILELKNTINAMVDQLNGFISEVTRVAREVGTEGKLGQAAAVTIEVGGVWKDLTDNVNLMAGNLTGQVRNIAEVTTAVANGDLSKKISIDVQGEFLQLKNTVNAMVDQLNAFASEVTRVACEVGVEGKLGGQAQSTEIGGVWKDLTDNVNQLAANLTNQVRAIAEVATAVIEGDLTRQVRVEASGEVAALKDTVNEMIRNLGETTRQNVEQDWLKTNRERFTRMLQGQRDLAAASDMILSELAPLVYAQHGVFYAMTRPGDGAEPLLELQATYGYDERRQLSVSFRVGDGLVGQCAKEGRRILLTEVPGDYVRINSGLGAAPPLNIILLPVLFEGSVRAVIELASFTAFSETHQAFLDQLPESIGLVLSTIEASTLTENLLKQAQSLAEELRAQQEELRESNEDLARQASLLAERNLESEQKNLEVQQSKLLVEEKVGELAVSSKYKSEFIANMSHELRTPLNSLLILAEQLGENPDRNLSATQLEYAAVILASGRDLLTLLNNVLDLAKMESGTVTVDPSTVGVDQLRRNLQREFDPVAHAKAVDFAVTIAPGCPTEFVTDEFRLRQILKNLLSNAFKFTEHGSVELQIGIADRGWNEDITALATATTVLRFAVRDTGIGVEFDQQRRIFEAFAQGDGTTARLYGGTGLGLSISCELVSLLGGEITLVSSAGEGSVFAVYLPLSRARSEPTSPLSQGGHRQHDGLVEGWSGNGTAEILDERAATRGLDDHPFESTTVLVIDDDFRNVFAMTALLERARATVISAESGAAAITLLQQTPVDIVLMDIMMPSMDGYETTRAIRALPQFATVPIIAVTGKVVAGERERCLEAGANGYVHKPVDTVELLLAVGRWLPDSATRRAAAGVELVTALSAAAHDTGPRGTAPDAPILIIDDNAAKRLALRAVLVPLGYSIVEAEGGIAALRCVIAQEFAVILCDVRMPAVDGFETARLIRKRQQSELTPIIFLTAFGSGDIDQTDLYAEGAVDFMFAPVPPAELRAKVAAFAGLFIKAERLATEARQVQADVEELRVLNDELSAIARLDGLTGLGNRRALEEDLTQLDARVIRYGHQYCLAILDIDYFKSYNDAYGHQGGDHVLQAFAHELKQQARSGDALYRYGGDEFVCVFPEQSLASGVQVVERLQRNMDRLALPHEGNPEHVVTFSAGVAVLSQDLVKTANAILKEADEALYRAKELGRNRVESVHHWALGERDRI